MTFDIARLRLRNGRLTGAPFASPEEVVGWHGAVQAQDYSGAKWGIAQRLRRGFDRDVERACDEGKIIRTHVLRPTWHFVLPADLPWLLALTAARVKQGMAYYDRKLALDERTFARSQDAIAAALAGAKQLTRSELGRVLAEAKIDATGPRLGQLLMRAELDAVICSGARRGKQSTHALVSERCPAAAPLARDEALGKLARRYFVSHGPALVQDFAWWSGLTVTEARRGIELAQPALSSRAHGSRTWWFAEPARIARVKEPIAHLLPNYDEYLIAYQDHSASLDPSVAKKLGPRAHSLANNIVVLNGKVIGGWRRALAGKAVTVTATLAVKLDGAERRALDAAVVRFGQFLDLPARLVSC